MATKVSKSVRTPVVLQMEATECGAASLGIVLAYYGRIVPLPVLRRECGVSRDGAKASNVLRAARRHGMVAKGFKKSVDKVREVRFPAIVFWNFNHYLVLEGFKKGWAYLNDPAGGRRRVTLEEFDECFTGVVLVMEPGPDFEKGGKRRSVVRTLAKVLQGSRVALLYCILAGLLLVVPRLTFPVLTQLFVDEILILGKLGWMNVLVVAMAATLLLQGLLGYLQLKHLRQLRVKLAVGLSSRFFWHVLRLPVGYFAQRYSGEIAGRIGLNDKVARTLSGELATATIDCVMLVFYAALMLHYDTLLTGIGVGLALVNMVCLRLIARHRKTANRRMLQEEGKLVGVAVAGLQSIETLKASAQESSFFVRWAGHHAQAMNARQSMSLANELLAALPALLTTLSTALILTIGGIRVIDGALTIGMLIAFQSLMLSFQEPVRALLNMGSTLQELSGDLDRLSDVLEHPTDSQLVRRQSADESGDATGARLQGFVELREVTFGYASVAPPLIEGFSMSLTPGQRVALVGGSGSGKSTLAKLVAGLYQPWSGDLLLDGAPLSDVPRPTLATSLAMVDQDLFFFGGSVADNLTLWDQGVSEQDLESACRDADIHDVVLSLPGSYGAGADEGAGNLSGGQRQRLEIARALVNNPSILVLDEATSALDAETEHRIDQNLRRRGCTCIVVAHRLSTIRDCDEIIVLSAGKVVQRGTYEQLRAEGGAFAELLRATGEGSLEKHDG